MTRTLRVTDETYERITRLAKESDQTPEEWLESWLDQSRLWDEAAHNVLEDSSYQEFRAFLDKFDQWAVQQPAAQREAVVFQLRLVFAAFLEDQIGRDPLKEPRYQTFEEFFHDLGMTDEQIADAKRRGAERANV